MSDPDGCRVGLAVGFMSTVGFEAARMLCLLSDVSFVHVLVTWRLLKTAQTTDKAVAVHYGQDTWSGHDLGYVLELSLDSLNRGALIQWLSQYPGEVSRQRPH